MNKILKSALVVPVFLTGTLAGRTNVIGEKTSDTILFMGRIMNPETK